MARYEILCVDDDARLRHVIAAEIEEAGHLVMCAGSGTAALGLIANVPTLDLVLTDFCLPDMSAAELIQKARRIRPAVKLALLTGYAEILGEQGPDRCPVIAKTARMQDILAGIEAAARGENLPAVLQDAPPARVDSLLASLAASPAVEGIQRQLQLVYAKTLQEALPKPLSRLLDRLT